MSTNGPVLVAASWFPPSVGGSATVCRNLWGAWPQEDLVVVSHRPRGIPVDPGAQLPGLRVHYIETWPFQGARLATELDPLASSTVMRTIVRIAKEHKARAIWANWPSTAFAIGAWRAAKMLRLPFFFHLHDCWRESYHGKKRYVERAAAAIFENRVMRSADRVFTITDRAQAYFEKTRGLKSYVLDHCAPDADLRSFPAWRPIDRAVPVLHFAGSVYGLMNLDALVNFARALDHCKRHLLLECYTPNDPVNLAAAGITGPKVQLQFGSRAEVMAAQRQADVLLLPLAFRSNNPVEVQTVFPTKLLEYFVSGRPIVVHAPAGSWCAEHARKNGWGVVVDSPEPQAVADAIDFLLDNPQQQQKCVAAAQREARRRAASRVVAELQEEINRIVGCGVTLGRQA